MSGAVTYAPGAADPAAIEILNRRNAMRLLPVIVGGYILNTLAKTNVGFASLDMSRDLGFSPAVYGIGAGLFFLTYALCEIPSNLILRRVGARWWLSRIMISWGLVAMAMALITGWKSFYALRLLLGVAEAGWYPGVIFFLSLWFPRAFRARAMMLALMGGPIATVLGSVLSGWLLDMPPLLGIASWRWMFALEAFPSVILGILALKVLRDNPGEAYWLSPEEKTALREALKQDLADRSAVRKTGNGAPYAGRLVLYCAVNFASALGLYNTLFWLPSALQQIGNLSHTATGFAAGGPFLFVAVALVLLAWSSDRRGERKWHVAIAFLLAGAAMALIVSTTIAVVQLALLTFAMTAAWGIQATLFAMISEELESTASSETAFAGGLAAVTTLGNLAGFVGSVATGYLVSAQGSYNSALLLVAGAFTVSGLLVAFAQPQQQVRLEHGAARA